MKALSTNFVPFHYGLSSVGDNRRAGINVRIETRISLYVDPDTPCKQTLIILITIFIDYIFDCIISPIPLHGILGML